MNGKKIYDWYWDKANELMEENKRLRENNQAYQEELCRVWDIRDDLYRRIYTAVDYIEEYQEVLKEHDGDWLNYKDGFKPYLLKILEGSDKE